MAKTKFQRVMKICEVEPGSEAYERAEALAAGQDMDDVFQRFLRRMRAHSVGLPGSPEFTTNRDRQLLHLANRMVRGEQPAHAEFLLELVSDPDAVRQPLLQAQLGLAALKHDDEAEKRVMRAIMAIPDPTDELLAVYERRNLTHKLSTRLELFEKRWGPRRSTGMEGLRDITKNRGPSPLDTDLLKWTWSISEAGIDDFEEYAARAYWGHLAPDYIRDLVFAAQDIVNDAEAGGAVSDADLAWARSVFAEIDSLVPDYPEAEIMAEFESGRSVVACISHFGLPMALQYLARTKRLPFFRIGLRSAEMQLNPRADSLDPRENVTPQMLKLARSARDEPRVIGMAPDGQIGDRLTEFPFLGRRVSIGQGAPSLAYLARAKSIFLGANWKDERVEIYYRLGPIADEGTSREEFFRQWNEFYLGCLKEIVVGPPENLRFSGGIWKNMQR